MLGMLQLCQDLSTAGDRGPRLRGIHTARCIGHSAAWFRQHHVDGQIPQRQHQTFQIPDLYRTRGRGRHLRRRRQRIRGSGENQRARAVHSAGGRNGLFDSFLNMFGILIVKLQYRLECPKLCCQGGAEPKTLN